MLEFDPLDEYPIHQVPLPMRYVASSDRNVYDRCIYQGVDHEADAYFITGMGVYPNLGVMDAYATVRRGDKQWAIRASGVASRRQAEPAGRAVPHRGHRAVPRAAPHLRRRRPRHRLRPRVPLRVRPDLRARSTSAARATASCSTRRASPASARGRRRAARRRRHDRGHARSLHRDTRPVVGHPARRRGRTRRAGRNDFTGMWWCWIPLRFDDFMLHVILEEDRDGLRNTNFAVRVLARGDRHGRPSNSAGRSRRSRYQSGTRNPTRASIELTNREGKKSTLEIEPLDRHLAQRRLRLRRRSRLDARPLEGRRLGRGLGLRLQRSGRDRPGRVLVVGPRRPRHVRRSRGLRHLRARLHRHARTVRLHRHDAGRALSTRARVGERGCCGSFVDQRSPRSRFSTVSVMNPALNASTSFVNVVVVEAQSEAAITFWVTTFGWNTPLPTAPDCNV